MVKETFDRNKPGIVLSPPPSGNFVGLGITVTAGVLNNVSLTFSEQIASNYYAAIYLTNQTTLGIMSPKTSSFRLIQATVVPVTPFIIDAKVSYQSRFGVPEVSSKIFCRIFFIDSNTGARYNAGQISTKVIEV